MKANDPLAELHLCKYKWLHGSSVQSLTNRAVVNQLDDIVFVPAIQLEQTFLLTFCSTDGPYYWGLLLPRIWPKNTFSYLD